MVKYLFIFYDSHIDYVNEVLKDLPNQQGNIYVMPDYKACRKIQGANVYHFGNNVNDFKR